MNEGTAKETENPMQACMGMMKGMKAETDKGICPMAAMCKGMMEKPGFGFLLMIPGAALIIGGVLIVIEPKILFWLMAGTSIILGLIMLVFASFIRKRAQ